MEGRGAFTFANGSVLESRFRNGAMVGGVGGGGGSFTMKEAVGGGEDDEWMIPIDRALSEQNLRAIQSRSGFGSGSQH